MKVSVHFLALIILLFVACQPVPKTVNVNGFVENTKAEKVLLTGNNVDLELDIVEGKFVTQFELEEAGFYNLRIGRESTTLFLSPGQSIDISIDTEEFDESIQYSGEGSEASNYLSAKYLRHEDELISRDSLYAMVESDFLEQLAKNEEDDLLFLEDKVEGLSAEFMALEKVNIDFDQKNHLLTYERGHAYYTKQKDFKASATLNEEIEGVNFNQVENIRSASFERFLKSYFGNKAYDLFKSDEQYGELGNIGILKANLDLISEKIKDKEVLAFTTDITIDQSMMYSSALGIEPILKDIRSMTNNQKTFDVINASLDKWGHLAKGMPAPDFDGMTLNGKVVKLSDLKGKNVYIDVWATWCGPCIGEQPSLFELEEKYKSNKNLAFMGVSIDSDKEAWTKMVTEKEMTGEQIFTDGAWKSAICTEYLINGIPRFILVDKKGNIINSDAPRPSSDQIKDILKDLSGEPLLSSL